MRIVYEPRGRALEYAPLAVNLYHGCSHYCDYCYVPDAMHIPRVEFGACVTPKEGALDRLLKDAIDMERAGDIREVLMSFGCDPHQQLDEQIGLTRKALIILLERGLNVAILTKGGLRSERDFDILERYRQQVRYGASLTFTNWWDEIRREPFAAPYSERCEVLLIAHNMGIPTWASLEPVYDPAQTLQIIEDTHEYVDEYRIGKLNHVEGGPGRLDLIEFCRVAKARLEMYGKRYVFKKSLQPYLDPGVEP